MLENWLQAAQVELPPSDLPMGMQNFGTSIRRITRFPADLDGVEVALIGGDPDSADTIRRQLYRLAAPSRPEAVADFGNCRKSGVNFVGPLLKELLQAGIIPILIAGEQRLIAAQFQAYRGNRRSVNAVVIDECIRLLPESDDLDKYPLNKLLFQRNTHLFSLGLIGYQRHFTPEEALFRLEEQHHEHIRLGLARESLPLAEPMIRDADMLAFHLNSIRASEMPGQFSPSPNGFTAEEGCRLARYAGYSDKLTSIGFYGYHPEADRDALGGQGVAQMIWYFLDGYFQRKNDFPKSTDGLLEYVVDSDELEHAVVFWKSSRSGRWWMQIPVQLRKKHQRHRLIPCTYEDYLQASRGDFPERLINALRKFE